MIQEAINIEAIFKIVLVLVVSDAVKMERSSLQTSQRNNKGKLPDAHEVRFFLSSKMYKKYFENNLIVFSM